MIVFESWIVLIDQFEGLALLTDKMDSKIRDLYIFLSRIDRLFY